jgi:hypothetical protein
MPSASRCAGFFARALARPRLRSHTSCGASQANFQAAHEAEERSTRLRRGATPTASPASQRPQRSLGAKGKPSPASAETMPLPPRPKRPGCEEAAAASTAARSIPGDIGRKQQAATAARPPPSPSKDISMPPPPPREPRAPTRGDRQQGASCCSVCRHGLRHEQGPQPRTAHARSDGCGCTSGRGPSSEQLPIAQDGRACATGACRDQGNRGRCAVAAGGPLGTERAALCGRACQGRAACVGHKAAATQPYRRRTGAS